MSVHIIVWDNCFWMEVYKTERKRKNERERERKREYFVYHMIKMGICEISTCPRKILLECIICMNDNIVLSVNKEFLSHKFYVAFIISIIKIN